MSSASADGRKPADTIVLCATLSSDSASGKEVRKEAKPDKGGAPAEDKTDPSNFKAFRHGRKTHGWSRGQEEGPHKSNFHRGDLHPERRC